MSAGASTDLQVKISLAGQSKSALQDTASGFADILTAIKNINQQTLQSIAKSVEDLSSKVGHLQSAGHSAGEGIKHIGEGSKEANRELRSLEYQIESVIRGTRVLVGGFLTLETVEFFRDLAAESGKTERMAIALETMGKNAGIAAGELERQDKAVQAMGVSIDASRSFLEKYVQANLDLSKVQQTVALAQNLSVVGNMSVAQSLQTLTFAMNEGRPEMLRRLGLFIDMNKALQDYAAANGTVVPLLTEQQRRQAAQNAVLEAGKNLQGVYAESLKTSAGQAELLSVNYSNLKDTIGEGLEPAYASILQVINEFITDLEKTYSADGDAKKGAESLAQSVHTLAEAVKNVLEFLTKHRALIEDVVGVYVIWNSGMRQVLEGLEAIGNVETGQKLADIVRAIAGLPPVTTAAAGGMESLAAAEGAATTQAALLKEALLALPFVGLLALLGEAVEGNGRFSQGLRDVIALLSGPLVAGVKSSEIAFVGLKGAVESIITLFTHGWSAAETQMESYFHKMKVLAKEVPRTSDFVKDLFTGSGLPGDHTGAPGGETENGEASAKAQGEVAAQLEHQNQVEKWQKALFGPLGAGSFETGKLESSGFQQLRIAFQGILNEKTTTQEMIKEAARKLSESAKTPEDVRQLEQVIGAASQKGLIGKGIAGDVRTSVSEAALKSQKTEEGRGSAIRQETEAALRNKQQKTIEEYRDEEALLKEHNQEMEKSEKDAYSQNASLMDSYFSDRKKRLQEEFDAERKVSDAQIAQLRQQQRIEVDPEKKKAIQNQITALQDKQLQDNEKYQDSLSDVDREHAAALKKQGDLMDSLRATAEKFYNGEASSIDEINKKYDDMAKKLNLTRSALEALNAARQAELTQAHFKVEDAASKSTTDYEQSVIDLQKSQHKLNNYQNGGPFGPLDEMNQNNQSVYEQLEIVAQQFDQVQQHLQQLMTIYQQQGGSQNPDLNGLATQIVDLSTQSNKLAASFNELQTQVQHAGDQVQKWFSQDFTSALTGALSNVRKPGVGLLNSAVDFQKQIAGAFSSKVSGWFTQGISDLTSQKDQQGNPIKGTSVFDKIGSVLGMNKKPLGESPQNAMWVRIAMPQAAGMGVGSVGGSVLSQAGGFGGGPLSGDFQLPGMPNSWPANPTALAGMLPYVGRGGTGGLNGLLGHLVNQFAGGFGGGGMDPNSLFSASSGMSIADLASAGDLSTADLSVFETHAKGGPVKGYGVAGDGEFVMTKGATSRFAPLLHAMNNGEMQSIANRSTLPTPPTAGFGVIQGSGQGNATGPHSMMIQLHPNALQMTLSDWLQGEVARQYSRR